MSGVLVVFTTVALFPACMEMFKQWLLGKSRSTGGHGIQLRHNHANLPRRKSTQWKVVRMVIYTLKQMIEGENKQRDQPRFTVAVSN